MTVTLKDFNHSNTRSDLPNVKPGHIVKVYQKITETKGSGKKKEVKERIQVFEGLVLGRKGGTGINATITVRKISDGIGVEKVFPLNTPTIEKIELIKITKTRRAKLNYMRNRVGKATRPKGELIKPEDSVSEVKDDVKKSVKKEKVKEKEVVEKVKEKEVVEKVKEKTEKNKVEINIKDMVYGDEFN